MTKLTDQSNIPQTCPMINELTSAVKSASWPEDGFWDESRVLEILEQVRTANSKLRNWGNLLFAEKRLLEERLQFVKRELEELKYCNTVCQKLNRSTP